MPRFARMLVEGMRARGHSVEVLSPKPQFHGLPAPGVLKKWLGYLDQYVVFPTEVRKRLKSYSPDTLFVFADQALGPWVPLVADRSHVIHCHDFLALRSALGEIPENPTGWTGRQYQAYIRRGFSRGRYFISVSQKTREDLHRFLRIRPDSSKVVYNGLNQSFPPIAPAVARTRLSQKTGLDLSNGYLLHVGGNTWYKNRRGVLDIYEAWRRSSPTSLPLLLVGSRPDARLAGRLAQSPYREAIHSLSGLGNEDVRLAYAGACVFLFPSLAEGFGWPIAEAMAAGCPVVTTNEAPMTEVAGKAACFLPRHPFTKPDLTTWAEEAAQVVAGILRLSPVERQRVIEEGFTNAERFDPNQAMDRIEAMYKRILAECEIRGQAHHLPKPTFSPLEP